MRFFTSVFLLSNYCLSLNNIFEFCTEYFWFFNSKNFDLPRKYKNSVKRKPLHATD